MDNYERWVLHEAEQNSQLEKLPVCCECKEHIQTDDLYDIDGQLYCEHCMRGFKKPTEDYMKE
jgi:formylmethanofuran dehydrogenase subunit E